MVMSQTMSQKSAVLILGDLFLCVAVRRGLREVIKWPTSIVATLVMAVTGIRQDAYALAHPLQVEQDKPANERGYYLNPVELGYPESRGIDMQTSRVERPAQSVLPEAKNR